MNVLNEAIPHLLGLIPLQAITIENYTIENIKGMAHETKTELNTQAHIQPLTPFEIEKLTNGTLDSKSVFNFWFLGDLANVSNYLNNKRSVIKWGQREFSVYSKDDWTLNGWIKVIASEKMLENEPEPESEIENV